MKEKVKLRSYHMCISLTGALRNWQDYLYAGCVTNSEGRVMDPYEVKAEFLKAITEGKKVIPMNPACDNFDFQRGCLGHEQETAEEA